MIESNDKEENKQPSDGRADLRVVSDRVSQSYCSVLKNARMKNGFSMEDVANELKIPLVTLKALEEQDYEKLPADTYAIGYIRSYALLMGLNPDGLIKDFKQDKEYRNLGEQERLQRKKIEEQQKKLEEDPLVEIRVKQALVKAVDFWEQNKLSIVILALLLFIAFMLGLNYSSRKESENIEIIDRVSVESVDGSVVVSDIMDQPQTTPLIKEVIPAGDRLKMVFSGTSWVTVRNAENEVIHQSRKQKGEILELSGEAPFYLRLSKASVVNISFNGKDIETKDFVSADDQLYDFPLEPETK